MTVLRKAAIATLALAATGLLMPTAWACEADANWLPVTARPTNEDPTQGQPLADCDAYRWAWQAFLHVTQPRDDGAAEFLSYAGYNDVFRNPARKAALVEMGEMAVLPRSKLSEGETVTDGLLFSQAGSEALLVDRRGNPIYYSVHLNDDLVTFVTTNKLNDLATYADLGPIKDLEFSTGSLELKASWMIVDDANPPPNFILRRDVAVPTLVHKDGKIEFDWTVRPPRRVTLALIGLHVVGVIENHPEFIWATFEHVGLAPSGEKNPEEVPEDEVISRNDHLLYPAGTEKQKANFYWDLPDLAGFVLHGQTLSPTTPVFRDYPASKLDDAALDEEVLSLNDSVVGLFSNLRATADPRAWYRLVGAIWLENGKADLDKAWSYTDMKPNLAGETAMSNVSMESFTQTSSPNCFVCHDPSAKEEFGPAKINISHLISLFLSDSHNAAALEGARMAK